MRHDWHDHTDRHTGTGKQCTQWFHPWVQCFRQCSGSFFEMLFGDPHDFGRRGCCSFHFIRPQCLGKFIDLLLRQWTPSWCFDRGDQEPQFFFVEYLVVVEVRALKCFLQFCFGKLGQFQRRKHPWCKRCFGPLGVRASDVAGGGNGVTTAEVAGAVVAAVVA